MGETKLLPCPFCGGEAYEAARHNWAVACADCFAIGPVHVTREAAVREWNRRAPSQTTGETEETVG